MESSNAEGQLHVDGARIYRLPILEKIAKITNENDLAQLSLNVCSVELEWHYPDVQIRNLLLEEKGKFRAEGEINVHNRSLRGTVQLGAAPRLLDWLPKSEEVFPRKTTEYMWTTVHLSGTVDAPHTGSESANHRRDQGIAHHCAHPIVSAAQ